MNIVTDKNGAYDLDQVIAIVEVPCKAPNSTSTTSIPGASTARLYFHGATIATLIPYPAALAAWSRGSITS
jgi:hypothetical protein